MKTILFTSLLFITFNLMASDSTSSAYSKYGVGIRQGIGYNFLHYNYTPPTEVSNTISFINPAVFFEYRFTKMISGVSEIQYISKGFEESKNNVTLKNTTNFIGLNLLGKLRMGDDNDHNFFNILAGPSLGYFLNGNVSNNQNSAYLDIKKDNMNPLTLSTMVGMGYSHKWDRLECSIDLRGSINNMKVNKTGNYDILLNQFSFNIGVMYFLK
jgi:hypothetical protein